MAQNIKQEVFTGVVLMLIGAAIATILMIIVEARNPIQVKKCNDGWSTQEIDGKIVKTYVEESDTCTKGDK